MRQPGAPELGFVRTFDQIASILTERTGRHHSKQRVKQLCDGAERKIRQALTGVGMYEKWLPREIANHVVETSDVDLHNVGDGEYLVICGVVASPGNLELVRRELTKLIEEVRK